MSLINCSTAVIEPVAFWIEAVSSWKRVLLIKSLGSPTSGSTTKSLTIL